MQGIETHLLKGERPVIVAVPDDPLRKAADWFSHYHVHHLPVVSSLEERSLVGILSTLDIARYCAVNARANLDEVPISAAMVAAPETIAPHTTLRSVIEVFAAAQYQCLPVIDAAGHCVGIITVRDVIQAIAQDLKTG
jgi:CBS domain-containing protein